MVCVVSRADVGAHKKKLVGTACPVVPIRVTYYGVCCGVLSCDGLYSLSRNDKGEGDIEVQPSNLVTCHGVPWGRRGCV